MKPKKLAEICIDKYKTLFPDADSFTFNLKMEYDYPRQPLYGVHLMAHYHGHLHNSDIDIESQEYRDYLGTLSLHVHEKKSIKDIIRAVDAHVLNLGKDNHIEID